MEEKIRPEKRLGLSFSFQRGRLLIYYASIRELQEPEYIRFLFNSREKKLAIQVCEQIDRDGIRVPKKGETDKFQFDITSSPLLSVIYKACHWEFDKSYLVYGKSYPRNRLVGYDLNTAVVITQEQFVDPEGLE